MRRIYLHPTLGVVLWIRYPGSSSSSRAFRADAQHLLQDTQTSPLDIPNSQSRLNIGIAL
jgi:hypothetical protein